MSRANCAVDLKEDADSVRAMNRAGILLGDDIAVLVDGGFQKFFRAPSGKAKPATADELKALHDFEEDLRERWGRRVITTSRSEQYPLSTSMTE